MEIAEVRIDASSPLVGKILGDSAIRQEADVIILGVKPAEGPLVFNPAHERLIRAGDTLIVIGADTELRKLEALSHVAA